MTDRAATGIVFLLYLMAVFALAIFSHRLLAKRSFLAEYFLGSRGLGTWAFAFTFAATSASGGSFTGYPSLVYAYGWIVALWIASYMVVPIVTMGLLGKRLNQVARRANAITIPDVLRERFASPGIALFAMAVILFFLTVYLVAQFKAGAVILDALLEDTPYYVSEIVPAVERGLTWTGWDLPPNVGPGYVVSLVLFGVTVIVYTSYGGFRAVVWTDVLQGVVMGLGVVLLVPLTLSAAGGLERVTWELARRPPTLVRGTLRENNAREYQAIDPSAEELYVWESVTQDPEAEPTVRVARDGSRTVIEIFVSERTTARELVASVTADPKANALVRAFVPAFEGYDGSGLAITAKTKSEKPLRLRPGADSVFGPGRTDEGDPFLPLGMAIGFFFFWSLSGAAQPGNLVRLMAFDNTRTLRRAILTVTIYFGLIYLPIVFVFVSARVLIHPAELSAGSDQIMPALAKAVAPPALAGILIAAPFAAVMSTVDSFLLIASSGLVRDFYQRTIDPSVSEGAIRRMSYASTILVGVSAAVFALRPPEFLQTIIIFGGAGLSSTFFAPIFLGLYWKRMTPAGAWASMAGGFGTVLVLYSLGDGGRVFGLHPFVLSLSVSLLLAVLVSYVSPATPPEVLRRFFAAPADA